MNDAAYRLVSCLWELTLRCSMSCMHCGSTAGRARNQELTQAECLQVADQIVALGCEELTFIGGEIFLYSGWELIARHLSEKGVLVNLMSNGYRIGEDEIQQIKHAKLTNVGISIDGMEHNHNTIRRKKDSFAQIVKAFDLLNREHISIGAVTCLLQFNYSDLEDLYEFLVLHNVALWQLQLANPMGNLAGRRDLILGPELIPRLTDFIREKNMDGKMAVLAADSIGYYDDNEPYVRGRRSPLCYWEGCQAGISSLFIDSIGNVKGCGALYADVFIEGNVREKPLAEIWNDSGKFGYNRNFGAGLLTGFCSRCDAGDVCKGGCRAANFFTTGSLYESASCARRARQRV